jgi:hypothetical protein
MRWIRLAVFAALAAFAVALRARPFRWEARLDGPPPAAQVSAGRVAIKARDFLRPGGLGEAVLAGVHDKAGPRGLSILALALFGTAFALSFDAAAGLGGKAAAAVLAVPFLPLAMGDSAPDPWLFSALFAAAFLDIMVRARRREWPAAALVILPAITAAWPLFHDAGVLLAPFLALVTAADCLQSWWAAENAPQGGIYTSPQDPLLFREEELDMPAFLRVLRWETKMNQFLHQRLGLTASQLDSLKPWRAVEVLNSLLTIEDLPAQADVPDPGLAGGDFRARNRRMLEVSYRDALKLGVPKKAAPSEHKPLAPLPLWAPLTAAALAVVGVAVPPAGPQALGRLFATLSDAGSLLSVPSDWWVSGSRALQPAVPYFWVALILFFVTALIGVARNRQNFSPPFFIAGIVFLTVALPAPAAAPLVALTLLPFAASAVRGLWREDTLVRCLSGAAAFIVLLLLLFLADWDALPLAGTPGIGVVPDAAALSAPK